ncbi:MAG: TetR/AcrR family transcriptional regulator C-terminal domain-containing protein [Microthrixaceae bacterium]
MELLRERISDQIDSELLMGERWDEALPAFFRSYREVFAAHPKVVPLLATAPIRLPRAIEAYDRMVDLLNGAGVAPERALEILTALESFVIGSALDLAAPDVMWEIPEGVEAPHLAAALTDRGPHAGRAEAAFERGLELLLAAIGQPAGLSVDRLRRGPGRR